MATSLNLADLLNTATCLALATNDEFFEVDGQGVRGEFSDGVPKNSMTVNAYGLSLSGSSDSARTEVDDWYLLEVQIVVSSQNGVVHNDDRHRGPYLRSVTVQADPDESYKGSVLMAGTSPGTYEGATSQTSTVSGGLDGSVGLMPTAEGYGATVNVGGSVGWSKSTQITVPDVVADDQSTSSQLRYVYTINGGDKQGNGIAATIGPLAQVSINDLPIDIVWVWHYPRVQEDPNAGGSFRITLTVTCEYWYRDVDAGGVQTHSVSTVPKSFTVPVLFPSPPPTSKSGDSTDPKKH
ncbi:MAG TPA: hypothetical protein VFJ97_14365 [Dermatophilaceae bacterium]|nr:hypothetical protein [Dermatophilaceae bacterium]